MHLDIWTAATMAVTYWALYRAFVSLPKRR